MIQLVKPMKIENFPRPDARGTAPNARSVAEALGRLSTISLPYPRQEMLMREFDELRLLGIATKGQPQKGLSLLADTGSGKTETAKRFVSRFAPNADDGKRSVLIVPLEATGTTRSLFSSILSALGDDFAHRGTEQLLKDRVRRAFDQFRVELLIVDEIQHLALRSFGRDVTDTLKRFLDDGVVPIVFMGTLAAQDMFARNPELNGRLLAPCHLHPLQSDRKSDVALFRGFLEALDRELIAKSVFSLPSDLIDGENEHLLLDACNGTIGQLMGIVRTAARFALREGMHSILTEHLSEAIDVWSVQQGFLKANPFARGRGRA